MPMKKASVQGLYRCTHCVGGSFASRKASSSRDGTADGSHPPKLVAKHGKMVQLVSYSCSHSESWLDLTARLNSPSSKNLTISLLVGQQ